MRHFTILALGVPVMIIQSCVSDIVIEDNGSLPLVVECVLHKTETQTLKLYRMPSIYGKGELKPVEDAQVTITEVNKYEKEEAITFDRVDETNWSVDFEPQYGKLYRLQIITSDNDTLTAETRFPYDQRLYYWRKNLYDFDKRISSHYPTMYSMLSFEVRDGVVKDVGLNGLQYKSYTTASNRACKMWIFPHPKATPTTLPSDPHDIFTELFNLPYDVYHPEVYDYKGTVHPYGQLISTDHPFVDNLNLTEGNVSGLEWCNRPLNAGFVPGQPIKLPYNTGLWLDYFSLVLPLHKSFLRIDQPADFRRNMSKEDLEKSYLTTDRSFLLFADYDTDTYSSYQNCVHEVHFVSDEYDAYLRDLYIRKGRVSNFVLTVYDMTKVYSNVTGGTGIFGADNITWDIFDRYEYDRKQRPELFINIVVGEIPDEFLYI